MAFTAMEVEVVVAGETELDAEEETAEVEVDIVDEVKELEVEVESEGEDEETKELELELVDEVKELEVSSEEDDDELELEVEEVIGVEEVIVDDFDPRYTKAPTDATRTITTIITTTTIVPIARFCFKR